MDVVEVLVLYFNHTFSLLFERKHSTCLTYRTLLHVVTPFLSTFFPDHKIPAAHFSTPIIPGDKIAIQSSIELGPDVDAWSGSKSHTSLKDHGGSTVNVINE